MGIMSRDASGEIGIVQRIGYADTSVLAQLIILRECVVAFVAGDNHEYHSEYPK